MGANPLYYAVSHRDSATELSTVDPDFVQHEDHALKQLERAKPAAVVYDKNDYWFHYDLLAFPKLADYIANHYRVSDRFPEALIRLPDANISGGTYTLQFEHEHDWSEVYIPKPNNYLSAGPFSRRKIELLLTVEGPPGAFKKYPLRVLEAIRPGATLKAFCYGWLPLTETYAAAPFEISLGRLTTCSKDFSWSNVTGMQIGGWGRPGGRSQFAPFV
jgi:hypothetical protein